MSGSVAAAAITAGAALTGTAANIASTGKLNKKNRQWQEDMWNKTNAYNAPAAQMARFKAAGLNPHLIYGQGSNGNATMAAPPEQKVPEFNFADAAQAYIATRKQQTEIDTSESVQKVNEAEVLKKGAETANIMQNTAKTRYDLKLAEDLRQNVIDTANANLNNINIGGEKLRAEVVNLGEDLILKKQQGTMNEQQMAESRARIAKMGVEMQNLQSQILLSNANRDLVGVEAALKRADLILRQNGIMPQDPFYMRVGTQLLNSGGVLPQLRKLMNTKVPNFGSQLGEYLNKFLGGPLLKK